MSWILIFFTPLQHIHDPFRDADRITDREDAIIFIDTVRSQCNPLILLQGTPHLNVADTIGGLGFGDNSSAINTLIGFVDADNATSEINIFLAKRSSRDGDPPNTEPQKA